MKIIWLTPEVAYPPIGGRNGVFNRIVQMSKMNDIFLFSISYNKEEENISALEMKKYCKKVFHYNRGEHKKATLFKSLFIPFSVASRTSKIIQKEMIKVINEKKIDYIIIDFPNMALNVVKIKKHLKGIKVTLNQHNIEFERMSSMKNIKTISFPKRIMYFLESIRLKLYEKSLYKKNLIDSMTFFSSDDCEKFPRYFKNHKQVLEVFPLGANLPKYKSKIVGNRNLIFIGRLDNIAITNVEAVLWFVNDIFPKITSTFSDCKLIIAGANPSDRILQLKCDNIDVIPNYADVADIFDMGDCVILPLLSGGGVKGKLIEAAAYNKIIISTDKGTEGTCFKDKYHLFLANNANDFANCIINYFSNPKLYDEMRENCHRVFLDNYEWSSIVKKYYLFLKGRINNE